MIANGRVLDPDTGLDDIANVGIRGDSIVAVSSAPIDGVRVLDASGLVVAPGWIDLHSHSHTLAGHRLQAHDGVTSVLDLEAGVTPVAAAYLQAGKEGRPLNYGFSASWAQARMVAVGRMPRGGGITTLLGSLGDPAWMALASAGERRELESLLEADLDAGSIGIGLLVGYAPGVAPEEYLSIARLAATRGVPTFTHARDLVEQTPGIVIDGAEEIVRAAGETGAQMHFCHLNSISLRHVDRVNVLLDRARREGGHISTEAYPYGAGMTTVGAEFLAPGRLAARGLTPRSLVYARTGERIADTARLTHLRTEDPGGLVTVHYLDERDPSDAAFLDRALLGEGTLIASDAVPLTWQERDPDPAQWPLPATAMTHPRTAGTFSKVIRRYVRELGALSLMEAVRRCSLLPAQLLEASVPAMRAKGRIQEGCDADVIVFDPATVSDRATHGHGIGLSVGYQHVLVAGRAVISHGILVPDSLPGRPIRR